MADPYDNVRVGPTYETCPKCGGVDDGYGPPIYHFESCPDAPVGKARKAQGVAVNLEDLPDDLRRAIEEYRAPASSTPEPDNGR